MNAILIDDEPLALEYIEYQLNQIDYLQIIGKFTNPFEALAMIEKSNVDIVFLDIRMPGMNGIMVAKQITEINPNIQIIFITGYEDFAIKAFELNALDYVVKPVSKKRLLKALNRID